MQIVEFKDKELKFREPFNNLLAITSFKLLSKSFDFLHNVNDIFPYGGPI